MIAVLGGGAGGLSSTVELVKAGHTVHLWNRNLARFDPYRAECAIPYRGVLGSGRVEPALMTDDLRTALEGAEAVVVSLPSIAHPRLFADLAAERCDIPIVLNPGHTGGALHLRTAFASVGAPVPPVVEFSTLTYVARVDGDGTVNVTSRAGRVHAGALPGGTEALDWAKRLFPGAQAAPDVLASSLSNINLVLHPPGAILGAAWVEATGGDFTFYVDGVTPGVARLIEALDAERLQVAESFGHHLPTLLEEMSSVGTVDPEAAASGHTLEAIRGGEANKAIRAPDSLQHRYYVEDFAFGLLPFTALAVVAGVDVPVAESLLKVGEVLLGSDLTERGLNAKRLGIDRLTRTALMASVRTETT